MIKRILLSLATLLIAALPAAAADGLVTWASPFPAKATMDRLEAAARARGFKVFARIDHTAGAESIGQTLRPTAVMVFGNPKGGTPLMQCAQTAGIDLPLKALVWQDAAGKVWVGYNDPAWVAKRHDAGACAAVVGMTKALSELVQAALSH